MSTDYINSDPEQSRPWPGINRLAPAIDCDSTHGQITLKKYSGKWLVLFSHPADFTPVCTTEFISFANRYKHFKLLNTELLGLSIDSKYSHLAWMNNIKEKFGVEVKFPVLADQHMKVAKDYGMIHPEESDTSAVRATFIIDPKGIMRAMIYYPMSNGRSIDEILRMISALQTSDETGLVTPEGWMPDGDMLVKPPQTAAEMHERTATMSADEESELIDWYFCKKSG